MGFYCKSSFESIGKYKRNARKNGIDERNEKEISSVILK